MADNDCRCYATISDLTTLWRSMNAAEIERARRYISIVSAELRQKANAVGKNLDELAKDEDYAQILVSVVCDIVARVLMTSTDQEPMSQMSQTAGPYAVSGTFLVPGGGLFIKKSELARLGLLRQSWGALDVYT